MTMRLKAILGLMMLGTAAGAFAQAGQQFLTTLAPPGAVTPRATTRAPAPPLTRAAVWAVGSTQANGWDEGLTNAFITPSDHGGQQLRVAVWEVGYANSSSRIGKMNGTQLPQPTQTEALCGTNTTTPIWCNTGGIVTGYMVYYVLDGYQSGSFQDIATSLVFPYNQRNGQISIK